MSVAEASTSALKNVATKLRMHSVEATAAAGSGHPTSCASMADIMSVLFFDAMHFDPENPRDLANDRFVLSKGHAAPILYAAWAETGHVAVKDLTNLRDLDSDLEGHPTPRLDFVDVATGSLGQGLSAGAGMAYAAKNFEKSPAHVYVLMGDGETAEGSVWEAAAFASFYKLDNLTAIVDVNRLGQSDPTMLEHDMDTYAERWKAFGFKPIVVDGHDIDALKEAFDHAKATEGKPSVLLCKTYKGHDLPGADNLMGFHGKALDNSDQIVEHLKGELNGEDNPEIVKPEDGPSQFRPGDAAIELATPPKYEMGSQMATRKAFGEALKKLGDASKRVISCDGDVKNSTYSEVFAKAHPDRFIECYIAEQNMVGVGVGVATRGFCVFVSTFSAFFSRAFDQIRMAAISQTSCNFVGSHAGISIGEDGPSQMALEDLAMFRTIPECVVFYPSDAVSCERAMELAANYPRMTFTRTSRPGTEVIYGADETFEIGKGKVVRQSDDDAVTLIGCAVTLTECLKAADQLAKDGIHCRVIDPFTLKPLDEQLIIDSVKTTGGKVITVEDHYPEGGLGEAVAGALDGEVAMHMERLHVDRIPRSGEPDELLDMFGIDAKHIVAAAKKLVG